MCLSCMFKRPKNAAISGNSIDAIVDGNKVAEADIGAMLVANESAE